MTLENKKRVMNIPGVDGVPGVSAFVFNEAKKLALGIREMELKTDKPHPQPLRQRGGSGNIAGQPAPLVSHHLDPQSMGGRV